MAFICCTLKGSPSFLLLLFKVKVPQHILMGELLYAVLAPVRARTVQFSINTHKHTRTTHSNRRQKNVDEKGENEGKKNRKKGKTKVNGGENVEPFCRLEQFAPCLSVESA